MRLSLVGRSLLAGVAEATTAVTPRHDRTEASCAVPAGLGTTRTAASSPARLVSPAGPRSPRRRRARLRTGRRPATRRGARP
jgi:hypothetical protein